MAAFTVLFVDDETAIREAVVQLLAARRFSVLTAENGYEAMRILVEHHVDVLFTDIVMHDIDGIELAKRAKLLRPGLRILFQTGYPGRAQDARALGNLLIKPLRVRQIEAELRTLLAT